MRRGSERGAHRCSTDEPLWLKSADQTGRSWAAGGRFLRWCLAPHSAATGHRAVTADFSAAPSALGFTYQCEVALLEFLRQRDPALDIAIETVDDVVFTGQQTMLLQSKYEVSPGTITDASPRLWKTLRVWSACAETEADALLVLFTTSHAASGSIAALLRNDGDRDTTEAHRRLTDVARSTTNQELVSSTAAFLGLADDRRQAMVGRIVVVDDQPVVSDLDAAYAKELMHAAPRDRRAQLITRLREWWLLRAEEHLDAVARGLQPRIRGEEVEMKMADLRDQFTAENLPIDLEGMPQPTDEEVEADQRHFVMQLRLIALHNRRIALAVHDHNRAFAQRARWVREDLLVSGELGNYDARLREEWERIFLPDTHDGVELTEAEAQERGRDVHRTCEDALIEPIRPKVTTPYVMRGSLHLLAGRRDIGWHPDWVRRMQAVLGEVAQ